MSLAKNEITVAGKIPLNDKLLNRILFYLSHKKYEILLFSFMLLVFCNTFTPQHKIIGIVDIYQNFIIGLLVYYNKKWLRIFILCIILCSLALEVFEDSLPFLNGRSFHGILYLLFFSSVAIQVFKEVLYVKNVSRELLASALCGFVLLCLISAFLFLQIEIHQPHSFSNIGGEKDVVNNLTYFSFTTLFTLGFGDITPLTLISKRAVMLMGLFGHFYTVFITSIIIGKYIASIKN